ncbi:hypothetical protein [Corallococcus sp. CA047B]|uniref:hypothetical protein n=1 Tax=Corallococcus sp. CA047B TaxID=2316729 RepID=UPI001F2AA1A9|nr:hypothetical protein [Corallococcus sp. CA047B]
MSQTFAPEAPSRLRRHRSERPQGTEAARVARSDVVARAVGSGAEEADAFERLLVLAGLEPGDEMPLRASALTPRQAARLLAVLLKRPVSPGNFPPRMATSLLLREVLEGGAVSREELLRRVARFNRAVVLRPDGYLAWVMTGRTQQRVAPVQWKNGVFGALGFELGRFYLDTGGVFRPADEHLQPVFSSFVVEVYDDADVINRSLDGAGEAFFELAMAIGKFFSAPTDSLLSLRHLPEGIAALIAASPEYLECFTYMTRGEQIQAVAKLVTTLYACGGVAKGTTGTVTAAMGGVESMVPVLSLSAEGALVLERIAVPVGQMASSVGSGVGGLYVLSSSIENGRHGHESSDSLSGSGQGLSNEYSRMGSEGNGIFATIDKDGVVDLMIDAPAGSTIRGTELFRGMMAHFGGRVRAIRGTWRYGDNLGEVNRLVSQGTHLEDAVQRAWTARRAKDHGFSRAKVLSTKGRPGAYEFIQVLFER